MRTTGGQNFTAFVLARPEGTPQEQRKAAAVAAAAAARAKKKARG